MVVKEPKQLTAGEVLGVITHYPYLIESPSLKINSFFIALFSPLFVLGTRQLSKNCWWYGGLILIFSRFEYLHPRRIKTPTVLCVDFSVEYLRKINLDQSAFPHRWKNKIKKREWTTYRTTIDIQHDQLSGSLHHWWALFPIEDRLPL